MPRLGSYGSFHWMRTHFFTESERPRRAPLFAAMYTRGTPRSRASCDARSKTRSSRGPKVPFWYVMSLAISTISRPAGYSGVYICTHHASIPTLFDPGAFAVFTASTRSPSADNSSSVASISSAGGSPQPAGAFSHAALRASSYMWM